MYRQGLGDCFLLTFRLDPGQPPVQMLIDCGVLQKTEDEAKKMRRVAESIARDTDGKLDLLVVTHEHWDHVSGFAHAEDIFTTRIEIGQVWLSWAENREDTDALEIKAALGKNKEKVCGALKLIEARGVAARLAAAGDDPAARQMRDDLETTAGLLGFLGMAPGLAAHARKEELPPGVRGMLLGDTMDWLRSRVGPGDYCSPGQRRPLPGAAGVSVYVLGPPRDVKRIKQMDVTGEEDYKLQADRVSLLGALDWFDSDRKQPLPGPFRDRDRVTPEQAAAMPFFREYYGFADDPRGDEGRAWRRIDDEWLVDGASRLAVQLTDGVNNTSLALAFELPDGRTLIFPGDAQFGNWASWDKVEFQDGAPGSPPVRARQLLNQAVFYKVGHHGSHNATRRASLHEMISGELVAMIPTDEQFALRQPKRGSWKMPSKKLADDLAEITARRVIRADVDPEAFKNLGGVNASPRWEEFYGRVSFADEPLLEGQDPKKVPLYVEYHLPLK
jgi:hypothetical protein